jgi:hypothetical protein
MTMDYGAINQRLAEFDARHGANVCEEAWILFEDGAVREGNPMGPLMEPPSDPHQLAKRKERYHAVLLRRAVSAFEDRKRYYARAAKANLNQQWCAPVPVDAEAAAAELKALQAVVETCKRNHDQARAEVEKTVPASLKIRKEQDAANRKANETLLDRLKTIEV